MSHLDRIRLKMKVCRDEIEKFENMTSSNAKFKECMLQVVAIVSAHVDIMDSTLEMEFKEENE